MSGNPSFRVAVDEGDEASLANGVAAAFEQAIVFVFSVHDAGRAVVFDEGDGKEFSLGCADEAVKFSADCGRGHGLHFGLFYLVFVLLMPESEPVVFVAVAVGFEDADFISHAEDGEGDEDAKGDDEDGFHGFVWFGLVWFCLRGEIRRFGGVCQHDF